MQYHSLQKINAYIQVTFKHSSTGGQPMSSGKTRLEQYTVDWFLGFILAALMAVQGSIGRRHVLGTLVLNNGVSFRV